MTHETQDTGYDISQLDAGAHKKVTSVSALTQHVNPKVKEQVNEPLQRACHSQLQQNNDKHETTEFQMAVTALSGDDSDGDPFEMMHRRQNQDTSSKEIS